MMVDVNRPAAIVPQMSPVPRWNGAFSFDYPKAHRPMEKNSVELVQD
jgi:hypothetical protein